MGPSLMEKIIEDTFYTRGDGQLQLYMAIEDFIVLERKFTPDAVFSASLATSIGRGKLLIHQGRPVLSSTL